jgi:DNA polymerase-3 subunit epsilon
MGSLQAAVEMLEYPDLDPSTRERFINVIRDEVRLMTARLNEVASHTTQDQKTRWPLEDMLGADLVSAAQRRIENLYGCHVGAEGVDATLWLRVDSFSLMQALAHLAGRLVEEYEITVLKLRLNAAGPRAHLTRDQSRRSTRPPGKPTP